MLCQLSYGGLNQGKKQVTPVSTLLCLFISFAFKKVYSMDEKPSERQENERAVHEEQERERSQKEDQEQEKALRENQEREKTLREEAKKKLKEGWIHSVMMLEVVAISEEAARSSLEKHVDQLKKEKKALVFRTDYKDILRLEKPFPSVEVGYSYLVEVELVVQNFDALVFVAMNYAPSSIEILHPKEITLDQGEAQGIVASVTDMLHKFARQGLGGVVIRS